jgi:hypothetical protein
MKTKILKVVCLSLAIFIFLLVASVFGNMYTGMVLNIREQEKYLDELKERYEKGEIAPVNEQDFCDFSLADALESGVRYNGLQYVATHNSYKLGLSGVSKVFFTAASLFMDMDKNEYDYELATYTRQLDAGMRVIEIDTGYMDILNNKRKYLLCHHAILDNRSHAFDLRLALEELLLWSQNNPGHLPVTIIYEPKNEFLYAPGLKQHKLEQLNEIDSIIRDVLGEHIFTAKDFLNGEEDFDIMRENNNFPLIQDMLGKFLFLQMPNECLDEYIAQDISLSTQVMVPSVWYHKLDTPYAQYKPFVFIDDPDTLDGEGNNVARALSERNYLVRTRMDFFPRHSEERRKTAIDTLAVIVSTDYPKDNPMTDFYNAFDGGYTVRLRTA